MKDDIIFDGEGDKLSPDTPVSMNLWGLGQEVIYECNRGFPKFIKENLEKNPNGCEYFLPSVISKLIDERKIKIKAIETEDIWYGVTYRNDKKDFSLAIKGMIEKGIYPEKL